MNAVQIDLGFDESEREHIGALYWEAFRRKLRPAFGDDAVGLRVIRAAMRSDRMLVARSEGGVVGVCGFHADGTGAVELSMKSLRSHLSIGGALRAALVLGVLAREEHPGSLVLDGICVDADQRGAGIGTSLLDAAERLARNRGATSVRLSVVDSNPRARALYMRRGFVQIESGALGLLGFVYGFDRYTVLTKELSS